MAARRGEQSSGPKMVKALMHVSQVVGKISAGT